MSRLEPKTESPIRHSNPQGEDRPSVNKSVQFESFERYSRVRAQTAALAAPYSPEDLNLQPMADASPGKWHLGHTSWFFETFLLRRFDARYTPFDQRFRDLFNSYYDGVGPQPARDRRAYSRPSLTEVLAYRASVDEAMASLWPRLEEAERLAATSVLEFGIQHEQQHQELFLTDLKYALAQAPLRPQRETPKEQKEGEKKDKASPRLEFLEQPEGVFEIGASGTNGFSFDIERPRHRAILGPHLLASRLVTNAEYLAFIEDKGYSRSEFWLSEGFSLAKREGWQAPLYWARRDGNFVHATHDGAEVPLDGNAPVSHVSYYEAQAYAVWAQARLPTEAEWEQAAASLPVQGNFLESGPLAAAPAQGPGLTQFFGDAWEWTQSAFLPYPGFRSEDGILGEYNGKFAVNQMILRGGSAFSPQSHLRASYRNFFPPHVRWQLTGIRLANDAL